MFSLLYYYSSSVFSFATCLFVPWILTFGYKLNFCFLPTCVSCVWAPFSFKRDNYSSKWSHVYLWPQVAVAQELERVIQLFGRSVCCFKSPAPPATCQSILWARSCSLCRQCTNVCVWIGECDKCCEALWAVSRWFSHAAIVAQRDPLLLISLRPSPFIKMKYWQLTFL